MKFDLDGALINDILFHMENQEGEFMIDSERACVVDLFDGGGLGKEDREEGRFIPLPSWTPNDGYRLMEKFASGVKNPIARQELSDALGKSKGVFRAFKDALELHPQIEKQWYGFKEQRMKNEITAWYNSLRGEWGLEPVGEEPEDNSFLVLEDFNIRRDENTDSYTLCFVAENASGEICGVISGCFKSTHLYINKLEVKDGYRGLGLGKTLLSKLLGQVEGKTICIDVPAGSGFFTRSLLLEGFKLSSQTFVRP